MKYCEAEKITFTRCRAYRKNDQCFVEQKNGAIVRRVIGYDRLDGKAALKQMGELYLTLRLHTNFFQPSMKLLSKSREGGKVRKTYDPAKTPYRRILAAATFESSVLEDLEQLHRSLDPVRLGSLLQSQQDSLWKIAETTRYPSQSESLESATSLVKGPTMKRPKSARETQKRKYRKSTNKRVYPNRDIFKGVYVQLHEWMLASPALACKGLLRKLQELHPDQYPDTVLNSLQRRISVWRAELGIKPPRYVPPANPKLRTSKREPCSNEKWAIDRLLLNSKLDAAGGL